MNRIYRLAVAGAIALGAASAVSAQAANSDSERGTSLYDQDPACLERGELKAGQQAPRCVEITPGAPLGRVLPQNRTGVVNGPPADSLSTSPSTQNGGTFSNSTSGTPQNGGTFTGSTGNPQGGSTTVQRGAREPGNSRTTR